MYQQYNNARYNIMTLHTGDYVPNIDKTVYRFHSPITHLKSNLRNCLTYDNQNLVAVDIKNCQPYFSVILLNIKFWGLNFSDNLYDKGTLTLKDVNPALYKAMKIEMSQVMHNLLEEYQLQLEKDPDQLDLYINCIQSGVLYQEIANVLNRPDLAERIRNHNAKQYRIKNGLPLEGKAKRKIKPKIIDVKKVKGDFLVMFNGDNRYHNNTKLVFETLWPTPGSLFASLKRKNNGSLGTILMQIESHLVLKVICKRIATEEPNLPIFTIHDSIVTTVGYEKYVEQVIVEELEKAIGIPPTCKCEYWHPDNLEFFDGASYWEYLEACA